LAERGLELRELRPEETWYGRYGGWFTGILEWRYFHAAIGCRAWDVDEYFHCVRIQTSTREIGTGLSYIGASTLGLSGSEECLANSFLTLVRYSFQLLRDLC